MIHGFFPIQRFFPVSWVMCKGREGNLNDYQFLQEKVSIQNPKTDSNYTMKYSNVKTTRAAVGRKNKAW